MGMALDEMRINWDAKRILKLDPEKNKLLEKRTQKKKDETVIESKSKKIDKKSAVNAASAFD